ncbi:MAG: ATP-binding protein [Chloroflexota bacterium]
MKVPETVFVNRATVFVVEDDYNLVHGIRDILELHNYQVLTAMNGIEGLQVLRTCETLPDIIVSDIMMPGMNGYEFLEEVRKDMRWAAIPFIFLTARGEKADVRAGKSMGVDDYMVKPFNAEDLLIVIDARLKRRKELDKIHSTEIGTVKQNILTILNHEFRTPLTYLVAYADMLNQDTQALSFDELNIFLHAINVGAERMRRLIENFILLVELETGEGKKNFDQRKKLLDDPKALVNALNSIAEKAQGLAEVKHITLRIEPLSEPLPEVIADIEYLKIALYRLVDNSIKFTTLPNTVIKLSVYTSDSGELCFSVLDQGRGIPANELQAIFEMFYQVDRSTFEDQGAGAGLSIVKKIAQLHKGHVSVQSEVGQGSCFTLRLPPSDH